MTLDEYAAMEAALGARLLSRGGVWWRICKGGILRTLSPFHPVDPEKAKVPWMGRCIGYQHPVASSKRSNSVIRVLAFERPQEYSIENVPKAHRRNARKGLEHFRIERITDLAGFVEQAWPVYCDFYARTHYSHRRDRIRRDRFERWARALLASPKVVMLGAFDQDGRLCGVDSAWQVEDVIVAGPTFSRTEALRLRISDAMLHCLREAACGSSSRWLFMGLVTGVETLDQFKMGRGCSLVEVPALCRLNPLVRALAEWWRPADYARLGIMREVPDTKGQSGGATCRAGVPADDER